MSREMRTQSDDECCHVTARNGTVCEACGQIVGDKVLVGFLKAAVAKARSPEYKAATKK